MTEAGVNPTINPPWLRTSPAAILFFVGNVLKGMLNAGWAMIAGTYGAIQTGNVTYLLWGAGGLLIVMSLWAVIAWWRFRYRLDGDRMMVKRGVFHREQLTIEFARVQKTRVLEPFYLRPFGLALLEVDTAGSASEEVTLGGIDNALAHRLRDAIVARQRVATVDESDDEVTETAASDARNTVLSRNNRQIAQYGLTHNGMLWFVVVVATLVSQLDDSESWGMFKFVARWFDFEVWGSLQIALAILSLLVLMPLLSMIGALWRYAGYTLFRDGETWRRHSGLLSKHDESIKQHKIQSILWKQNVIARALGLINIKLKQTSAGLAAAAQEGELKRKPDFLIPVLRPEEAEWVTGQLMPGARCREARFSRVDRKYIRKALFWGWSWSCALLVVIPIALLGWQAILLWPLAMLVGWLLMRQFWRQLGYAVDGDYGMIRTGFIGSKTTIFPLFKVQRVDIRQSPSQRRHRLAHLTIHLASHSVSLPWISLRDAQQFRDLALYQVETREEDWF